MENIQKHYSNILKGFKVSGLLFIPIISLWLPADFFDYGESICISKKILGIECYGCGITRAIMHLIHGDYQNALILNKLSVLVLPLLTILWLKLLLKEFGIFFLKWF